MRFLPLFLDLRAGKVALIGSGPAAVNKLRLLRAAGADVRWYSDDVDVAEEMLLASRPPGRLELSLADPLQANFREFRLVVAATGSALDDAVAALARTVNVPINVVDRLELSSFIFPAIVDRGDVVVAIGTGGASPVLARRLRERIEAILPARIGELATLLRRYRGRLSIARDGAQKVRRFWERAVDGPVGAAALGGPRRGCRGRAHPRHRRPGQGTPARRHRASRRCRPGRSRPPDVAGPARAAGRRHRLL